MSIRKRNSWRCHKCRDRKNSIYEEVVYDESRAKRPSESEEVFTPKDPKPPNMESLMLRMSAQLAKIDIQTLIDTNENISRLSAQVNDLQKQNEEKDKKKNKSNANRNEQNKPKTTRQMHRNQ